MAASVITGGSGAGASVHYTPSLTSVTKYVPQLFAAKALKNFYETTVFGSIANTDYAGEIKSQGDKVWIRTTPVIAITDYQIGDDITAKYELPNSAARELNIDQGLMWAFQQEDVDSVQSSINVMNLASSDAGERMAIEVDRNVLKFIAVGDTETSSATSSIVAANKPADSAGTGGAISGSIDLGNDINATLRPRVLSDGQTTASTDIIRAIVDMALVLDEQDIPQAGRWIVLPSWAIALLKTGDLRRVDVTGDGTGVIRNGAIGMVDNFTIYRSNNVYADETVGGEANFYIPFGVNEAITFASQFVKTETLRIQAQFGDYYRGLNIFGRAIVQPTACGLMYVTRG